MHSELERRIDIDERLAVGVMEVAGEFVEGHALCDSVDEGLSAMGCAGADGISERDFIAAALKETGSDFGCACWIYFAFVGTDERARDVAADRNVHGAGGDEDRREAFETLGDGAVDIALREGLRG